DGGRVIEIDHVASGRACGAPRCVDAGRRSRGLAMNEGAMPLVLNVDDYGPIRYARTQVLHRGGFRVSEAATGEDAVRVATTERPDGTLLDGHLPDMSGFDVCRLLKAEARTASVPILHVSSTCIEDHDRVHGLEGGADGYLVEPVSPAILLATVNAFLRARR